METLPENIKKALEKIAIDEGLFDYNIEFKAGSKHGDNFLGIATAIKMHGYHKINGKKEPKTLDLFCKSAPTNPERCKAFTTDKFFERETLMYTEILPEFLAFQKEKGLLASDMFKSYPKCYLAVADKEKNEFFIIMENLQSKGFEMWPKQKPMSLDHIKLIVHELGKLHGISFAVRDQKPDLFAKLRKLEDSSMQILEISFIGTFNMFFDNAIEVINCSEQRELLKYTKENMVKILGDSLDRDAAGRFGVVTHGDCWNNNLLFQHENKDQKAISISLLDWQVSRFVSPVLDLLYNLFTLIDKQARDKHWKEIIDLYYLSLARMITELGSDPETLFSYADLEAQLKTFGRFSVIWAVCFTNFGFVNSKEVKNLDDFSEEVSESKNVSIFTGIDDSKKDAFAESLNNVISDIINYGYVDLKNYK